MAAAAINTAAASTWLVPIVVALITGGFSYLGVSKTVKASYDKTLTEIKIEISGIKKDVGRLETKQDKHNAVIERTYKLEQKVEDLEKRIN